MTDTATIPTTEPVAATPPAPVTPPAAERPAWLPEKFSTAESLAQAYTELEKKLGAAAVPPKDAVGQATAEQKATEAGIDLNALGKEYVAGDKKLSDATLATLKSKGIPPEVVATYVQSAEKAASEIVAEITAVAGTTEKRDQVFAWAKANLKPDEIAGYNAVLDAGNKAASKMAFEGLYARYTQANGTEPGRTVGAGSPASSGPPPFRSKAEMVLAMQNPRYKQDEAYRQDVASRLKNSKL